MDFNTVVQALLDSKDNANIQMYVNDSAIEHTQNEYDCLTYLQGEFLTKLKSFMNPTS